MAKAKTKAQALVDRWVSLDKKKDKLYAERDQITLELSKLPDGEVRKTGYRVREAFENGDTEYGHGPVQRIKLVPLTKKEKAEDL